MSENKNISNTITLENRKRIMVTGITEVVSQVDKAVVAKTADSLINISGSELRVTKLNLEEGVLVVDGKIDSFKYCETQKGFFKRVFK